MGLSMVFRTFRLCIILGVLFFFEQNDVGSGEVLRPRGVSLSNGSGTVPFSFVNDDYCDCEDGSDEPGTAACPNSVFHCTNAGHRPKEIPSSWVNDGICDCCDTSDEYNSSSDCVNNCIELGRAAREEANRQRELLDKGYNLRLELSKQGKEKREEHKARIEKLKKEQEDAQKIKEEKEELRKEAEEKEKAALDKYKAEEDEKKRQKDELEMLQQQQQERANAEDAFNNLDVNEDGIITVNELQLFRKFDQNGDGVVSEEEAKFFLHMKEEMELEEFITTGWMIMKPIYMMDRMTTPEPPLVRPPPEETNEVTESYTDGEIQENQIEHEEPVEGDSSEEEEGEHHKDVEDDDELDDEEFDDEIPHPPSKEDDSKPPEKQEPKYDEETQKLIDAANEAREEFSKAEHEYRRISDDIRNVEQILEVDFGPEEEFATLKGQCFEFTDREYVYALCPFDRTSQRPKAGGSDTSLGYWGRWIGPEENKYSKMKFEGGVTCWNGPARSVVVNLHCGVENVLSAASEPSRCEYLFEFTTPAVCFTPPNQMDDKEHVHTEL
ncbi:glucosidase 2 subunit beta-like isoform X2 [Tachypleus tridentatus]|uniref:glucosidase 2 subunit beta-like isoform X2 n=1 Tax=Tachypleus tridentatus TaxID=6853 RepID=UPI003FD30EFE